MSISSNWIEPVSLIKSPHIALNNVDLPAPFEPIMVAKSPDFKVRDT